MAEHQITRDAFRGGQKKGHQKVPLILAHMRFVYNNAKESDCKDGHRHWRKIFEEDQAKFLTMMAKQEENFARAKVRNPPPKDKVQAAQDRYADEDGEQRALALLDRHLEAWEKKHGRAGSDRHAGAGVL